MMSLGENGFCKEEVKMVLAIFIVLALLHSSVFWLVFFYLKNYR